LFSERLGANRRQLIITRTNAVLFLIPGVNKLIVEVHIIYPFGYLRSGLQFNFMHFSLYIYI